MVTPLFITTRKRTDDRTFRTATDHRFEQSRRRRSPRTRHASLLCPDRTALSISNSFIFPLVRRLEKKKKNLNSFFSLRNLEHIIYLDCERMERRMATTYIFIRCSLLYYNTMYKVYAKVQTLLFICFSLRKSENSQYS